MAIPRASLIVVAVVALTFVAFAAQAIYGPGRALACSCIHPMPTLADVAGDPGTVVIAGTIGPQARDRTPVQVDIWFHGPNPQPVVWLAFGSQTMTSCDPFVTEGEQRVMVLARQERDVFGVNPCVAETGIIGTPEGDTALATAHDLFGGGQGMPTPQPTSPPVIVEPPGIDAARLYLLGAVGAAVLLFGGLILFAMLRRRRPSD